MAGWNLNCFPYAYMQYSVGGYGPDTPNYWKIQKYGNGDKANCNETNQFCWTVCAALGGMGHLCVCGFSSPGYRFPGSASR